MDTMPDRYSFLLRLWQAGSPEASLWRASLEDAHTHQLMGFDTLDALVEYLHNLPGPAPEGVKDGIKAG